MQSNFFTSTVVWISAEYTCPQGGRLHEAGTSGACVVRSAGEKVPEGGKPTDRTAAVTWARSPVCGPPALL